MLSEWFSMLGPIALAALVVTVPGLAAALAGGIRFDVAIGLAPALSLGILAIADAAASTLGMQWGLPVIVVGTLAVAVLNAAVGLGCRRASHRWPHLLAPDLRTGRRLPWTNAVVLVLAMLGGAYVVAAGIGAPGAINQTFDAPFHVNAISIVAQTHSATPSTVSSASGGTAFYPPLFHAVAGLLVIVTGISPIVAANIVALVIAGVMWPLSIALLVSAVVGPSRFGFAVAMLGSVLISVFPVLLLLFGVLWPNALSISVVPAVIALIAMALGLVRSRRVPLPLVLVAGLVVMPGLYYAHPGAAFVVIAIAVPMVVAAEAALLARRLPSRQGRARVLVLIALTVVAGVVFWRALDYVPGLASVRRFQWPAQASPSAALGEVLTLASPLNPDLWIYGLLVVLGVIAVARTRSWWLAGAHVLLAGLAILAIAYDTDLSQTLTGFWYNDPFRIMAPLAVTAVPLAAFGALAWRDSWANWLARHPVSGPEPVARVLRSQAAVASVVVGLIIVVLVPGTSGLGRISRALSGSYAGAGDQLVSDPERTLYESLASRAPANATIIGNPWSGEVYAGVLSGHRVVFGHMVVPASPERSLLAARFKDFTTDPAVCAAVKKLDIGIVVEDSHLFWADRDNRTRSYPGLTDLSGVPGLTPIGSGGTAKAWKVGACRS